MVACPMGNTAKRERCFRITCPSDLPAVPVLRRPRKSRDGSLLSPDSNGCWCSALPLTRLPSPLGASTCPLGLARAPLARSPSAPELRPRCRPRPRRPRLLRCEPLRLHAARAHHPAPRARRRHGSAVRSALRAPPARCCACELQASPSRCPATPPPALSTSPCTSSTASTAATSTRALPPPSAQSRTHETALTSRRARPSPTW